MENSVGLLLGYYRSTWGGDNNSWIEKLAVRLTPLADRLSVLTEEELYLLVDGDEEKRGKLYLEKGLADVEAVLSEAWSNAPWNK